VTVPLVPRAPRPALPDHPEFPFMVTAALQRYHCTIGELREDYWLNRAWRALMADAALKDRVARAGIAGVLVVSPGGGAAPTHPAERARLACQIVERIVADTAHDPARLGVTLQFAEAAVQLGEGCVASLLAQTVRADPTRWADLGRYADDLEPVIIPVALAAAHTAAA
jgi:hypothetical protein